MEAIKLNTIIKKDGEISIKGVPFKKGQDIEMIILIDSNNNGNKKFSTVNTLLKSDIIGIWQNRNDITDSSDFASKLRDKSQNRKFSNDND